MRAFLNKSRLEKSEKGNMKANLDERRREEKIKRMFYFWYRSLVRAMRRERVEETGKSADI